MRDIKCNDMKMWIAIKIAVINDDKCSNVHDYEKIYLAYNIVHKCARIRINCKFCILFIYVKDLSAGLRY